MKEKLARYLKKYIPLSEHEILLSIEIPPNKSLGDYSFPCFILSKIFKKSPSDIAKDLAGKISLGNEFEKLKASGPYINFFINPSYLSNETINRILKEKDKFGSSDEGRGRRILIEMSSPNIAKPFGIGHLRSTIIGNSVAKISSFLGYKTIKMNYFGDWGTQFGKLIVGYKKFGSAKKLRLNPINHLLEIYVRASKDRRLEDEARGWFKKLEGGNKGALKLWRLFRKLSLRDFESIYSLLNVKFDAISGESLYNKKVGAVIKELKQKKLLEKSQGALIVNLEKYNLGVSIIQKSDGASIYVARDLAAAIDRKKRYKFDRMFYEVGSEQTLHFKQLFKILELMGYSWAKNCAHIEHGMYLDSNGKKFATRKGKNVFMKAIFEETKELAKKEILKRDNKIPKRELENRASQIALASIVYGDLKNHRANNILFDIEKFISFEGDTGPYLLYSYARASSILKKAKYRRNTEFSSFPIESSEKNLISKMSEFPSIVEHAYKNLSPNIIANYSYQLAQAFNEFYHSGKVIGSGKEQFRLALVDSFSQVLKNSLFLLGIQVMEKM